MLTEWREAERLLGAASETSPARDVIQAAIGELRDAYFALTEVFDSRDETDEAIQRAENTLHTAHASLQRARRIARSAKQP